jgi:iron complex outermembrane recepter protein
MSIQRRVLSRVLFTCSLLVVLELLAGAEETTQGQLKSPSAAGNETIQLSDVEVKAQKFKDGSAENGYRVENVSIPGSLGSVSLQDTPYSINVIPSEMMENHQIRTLKEITKYLPSAQIEERGGPDLGRPQTRGFEGSVVQNNRMDGMNMVSTTAYPMEQFDRIEVLNGLGGAMYGPANPSGIFNYVLKRPTDKPLRRLFLDYDSDLMGTAHVDVGDRLGKDGWFGYRINMLAGNGTGFVEHSNLRRELASVAFDVRPFKNSIIELNYSYYDFTKRGYPGAFSFGPTINLPDAPDPTREGYGQKYAGMRCTTQTSSIRVKHAFNEDWKLIFGFLDQWAVRDMFSPTNTLTNNSGAYKTTISSTAASRFEVDSNLAYLDGHFKTWGVTHNVVAGTTGFEWRLYSGKSTTNLTLGTASISDPQVFAEPTWPTKAGHYKSSVVHQQGVNLTDTISFNKYVSIRLSGSHDWIWVDNYKSTGAWTSAYDDSGFSGATSLMVKPLDYITTYFTYANSLQQGDTAPTTGPVNAGENLPAYRSTQYEFGVKAALSRINLGAAMFRIERPFAYTDSADNTFKNMGNQVNYGYELTAQGEVFDGLTAYAGVTMLDPKLKNTGKASTTNKRIVGVPEYQSNMLLEYRIPFVDGLFGHFNWHYTGNRPANDTNTSWAKSYNTFDIGARYSTRLVKIPTTFRLAINNLSDERYWSSIFPGSINGTGGSSSAFMGTPREYKFSMQMDF